MRKCVWVVINLDLGWDNVVGIYDMEDVTFEQLEEFFPEDERYYISDRQISSKV